MARSARGDEAPRQGTASSAGLDARRDRDAVDHAASEHAASEHAASEHTTVDQAASDQATVNLTTVDHETSRDEAARLITLALRIAFVMLGVIPWVLPIARARLPLGRVGDLVDAAFTTMCHRLPERSLAFSGVLMPLCSRCAGIFAGLAAGAIVARPRASTRAYKLALTLTGVAMLADVVAQDLGLHPVWHATRIATGAAFGYAMGAACLVALQRR